MANNNIEAFLEGILAAINSGDANLPVPSWNIEKYLAAIYQAIKEKDPADPVTPEMFGAKGDGITDDTQALRDAVNSGYPVHLSKTYKITSTIQIAGSLVMYGYGKIYMPNSDTTKSVFEVQTTGNVVCEGVTFYSERDNTNVFPPTGHTRATGSKSSNVIAFLVLAVDNLVLNDCVCDCLEYDVKTTTPSSGISTKNSIKLKNHKSTNYSMCCYISNTGEFTVDGGEFSCYSLLGSGDHTFYCSESVENVFINNPVITSYVKTGTTYDLHFLSSGTETGNNVHVDGAIIRGNSFVACNYDGDVEFRNCRFYSLGDGTSASAFNAIYLKGASTYNRTTPYRFVNCYFSPRTNLQNAIPLASPVKFDSCEFDGWIFTVASDAGDDQTSNKFVFDNCVISAKDTDTSSMFYCGSIAFDYEIMISNSRLYQKLGDGLASLRGSGQQIIGFYNCHLIREAAKPYLEYAASYNGIYKFFGCCSEKGKMRKTGANATFIDVNNGFAT